MKLQSKKEFKGAYQRMMFIVYEVDVTFKIGKNDDSNFLDSFESDHT